MADNMEYRKKVEEQLNRLNVKTINCKGYIGTVVKNKEGKYELKFDKMALSAVVDYEKKEAQKEGEER